MSKYFLSSLHIFIPVNNIDCGKKVKYMVLNTDVASHNSNKDISNVSEAWQ